MGYVIAGVIGFLAALLFDLLSLKRVPGAKQCVGALAAGLIGWATVMVCLDSDRVALPGWLNAFGWVLLAASLLLVIYSMFINLPWRQTYVAHGTADTLVKTGTYALVRHPGVLWYAALLISLVLVSRSKLLFVAAPAWFLADVVYVLIQDRFLFGKMFAGYNDYRHQTPMLIPTRKSVGACLKTLRLTRSQSRIQAKGV